MKIQIMNISGGKRRMAGQPVCLGVLFWNLLMKLIGLGFAFWALPWGPSCIYVFFCLFAVWVHLQIRADALINARHSWLPAPGFPLFFPF